jgi:hypothetical protein
MRSQGKSPDLKDFSKALDATGFIGAVRDAVDANGFAVAFRSAFDWRNAGNSFLSGLRNGRLLLTGRNDAILQPLREGRHTVFERSEQVVTEAEPHLDPTSDEAEVTEALTPESTGQERAETRLFGKPPPLTADSDERDLGTEILLHIMGIGDRRFVEPGWAGHPGSRRQIEAMSIRPCDELSPGAIEFRVFAQEGRATAWVSSGNYARARGRQLALTGFAVRPAPQVSDRFDVVYEGCFFEGGVVGPKRNGEICASPVPNDPLEAVRVRIVPVKAVRIGHGRR